MATFYATFFPIGNYSAHGRDHTIGTGKGALGLTALTTSGSAQTVQRASASWTAPSDGFVVVYCDGNVRVAAGETAAVGASPVGHFVPGTQLYPLSITAGESLSVIDV
jgi:hypothetical protein